MLFLLEANSDLRGTSLVLPLGIQKHLFYRLSENAGDLESERQTGIVLPVSSALIVPRATPTCAASSACDHSFSALSTRRRVFIDNARNTESIRRSTK